MSFKKKGGDWGPGCERLLTNAVDLIADSFGRGPQLLADSLSIEPPVADCRVFLGDSRDLPAALPAGMVKSRRHHITALSQPDELHPRASSLHVLARVSLDGRAAGELDWKAIGGTWGCATSMLNTWTPKATGEIPFPHFVRIIRDMRQGACLALAATSTSTSRTSRATWWASARCSPRR